jgi:small subunit ribosomal protein S2
VQGRVLATAAKETSMAVVTMRQLLEAGVHFGHQTRRWNPKMRRFIFGERSGIYIIDLQQTLPSIDTAYSFVRDLSAQGGTVLFIGTKKQAQDPIQEQAERSNMPYINQRWLGGMLTNFETIAKRVAKMQEYQRMRDSGEFEAMPKKEALILGRELEKLERNLSGIRNMARRPDAVFVLDTKKEHLAVAEANKLGIPVVAVVDTNCDPDLVQYVIPGNDDAIRASQLMCRVIADAVIEGKYIASKRSPAVAAPAAAVRSPEEEAAFQSDQAAARRQAAAAQAERDARVAAQRASAERGAASASNGDGGASVAPVELDETAPLVEEVATDAGPEAEAALADVRAELAPDAEAAVADSGAPEPAPAAAPATADSAAQAEPAAIQPEPAATQAEPAATQAEPAATQAEPAATQAEPAATQAEASTEASEATAAPANPAAANEPAATEAEVSTSPASTPEATES